MLRVLGICRNTQLFREERINDILDEPTTKWYFTDYCDIQYKIGHRFETGEILEDIRLNFVSTLFYTSDKIEIGYKHLYKISNIDDSKLKYLTQHTYVENPIELK